MCRLGVQGQSQMLLLSSDICSLDMQGEKPSAVIVDDAGAR